jgi:hypothetical protein
VCLIFQPARGATLCDYSYLLRQPTFELVAPEASSVDAPLLTPLGISADNDNFGIVKQVQLIPDKGKPVALPPKFKPASKKIVTMPLPELSPSTTYDVVLTVQTIDTPPNCPRVLTEHVARFTTESATSLDAIALQRAKAEPPTGKPTGPDIFENALKELRTLEYPSYVSFMVTTRANVQGKAFVESFRSLVRSSDDYVTTHKVPIATTNKPESPWGWNINIPILSQLFPLHKNNGNHDEPFGVPQMSPQYTFGLRPSAPAHFSRVRPEPTATSDIKTLGHIRTVGRDYDATLLDTEPYFNRFVYHLKLTPLGDPRVYRLREAWVDTQAYIIWKLRVDGIFDTGPSSKVPWDVYYTLFQGHWFIALETTTETVRTGGFLEGTPETVWNGISYRFSDFSFPDNVMDFELFSELKTDAVQY